MEIGPLGTYRSLCDLVILLAICECVRVFVRVRRGLIGGEEGFVLVCWLWIFYFMGRFKKYQLITIIWNNKY